MKSNARAACRRLELPSCRSPYYCDSIWTTETGMRPRWSDRKRVVAPRQWNGALVYTAARHGRTALMLAARNGHVRVLKLLIAAGADLAAKDDGYGLDRCAAFLLGSPSDLACACGAGTPHSCMRRATVPHAQSSCSSLPAPTSRRRTTAGRAGPLATVMRRYRTPARSKDAAGCMAGGLR